MFRPQTVTIKHGKYLFATQASYPIYLFDMYMIYSALKPA